MLGNNSSKEFEGFCEELKAVSREGTLQERNENVGRIINPYLDKLLQVIREAIELECVRTKIAAVESRHVTATRGLLIEMHFERKEDGTSED